MTGWTPVNPVGGMNGGGWDMDVLVICALWDGPVVAALVQVASHPLRAERKLFYAHCMMWVYVGEGIRFIWFMWVLRCVYVQAYLFLNQQNLQMRCLE